MIAVGVFFGSAFPFSISGAKLPKSAAQLLDISLRAGLGADDQLPVAGLVGGRSPAVPWVVLPMQRPSGCPLREFGPLAADRSLRSVAIPRLLREAGRVLISLAEHYGKPADEKIYDVDWLALANKTRWLVLMKGAEIRRRKPERDALVTQVRVFCLAPGNLKSANVARL